VAIVLLLAFIALPPMPSGNRYPEHNHWMQMGREIGQMLFEYSTDNTDNANAYPDGKSSTEIFQMLIDKGYCSDPTIFYVPLPGKVMPVSGQKLKPENVSWDVTGGAAADAPDGLPLVFLTGYKVTYAPGAAAVPVIKPYPRYGGDSGWFSWLRTRDEGPPGIAVFYKGNNAKYSNLDRSSPNIPNFVPPTFDANGWTFRQLTPDGPLP
jgi:hypothetical protein